MKILIIINSNNINIFQVKNCYNKIELFACLLRKYLIRIPGVEILIDRCYPLLSIKPNCRSLLNNYPFVDHIIFIDDLGFFDKDPSFLPFIKKFSKFTVSSLCLSSRFYSGEDIIFSFTNDNLLEKEFYIRPSLDKHLYDYKKKNNTLYFLINKPEDATLSNNTEINFLLSEIDKLKNNNIVIGLINTKSLDIINSNGTLVTTIVFNNYQDYIIEISMANIFFYVNQSTDIFILYEFSMTNTLVISRFNSLPHKIIKELNLFIYTNNLNWDEIFNRMNSNQTRNFLIQNHYLWKSTAKIIFNHLLAKQQIIIEDNNPGISNEFEIPNRHYHFLNIINKSTPHNINLNLNNNTMLTNEQVKTLSNQLFRIDNKVDNIKENKQKTRLLLQSNILL